MPQNSINTNVSAFVALQNLNTVNNRLDSIQNRVSTGLKVNSAVDDASNYAIAQGTRGNLKAYEAVSQGLANARGIATVSLAGVIACRAGYGDEADPNANLPLVNHPSAAFLGLDERALAETEMGLKRKFEALGDLV